MTDQVVGAVQEQEIVSEDAQKEELVQTTPDDFQVTQEEPQEVQQPSESDGNWEHKYKVLKGKFDKEVPRLYKEIKMLKREKEELYQRTALLEQLLGQMQQQKPQPQSEESVDEDIVKLKNDYPDIYNAISKLLQKEVKPKLEEVKTQNAQMAFYASLDAKAPDWRTLNTDPDFLDWLQEPSSEVPTLTRHKILLTAFSQGDADTVASFFNTYKAKRQSESQAVKTSSAVQNTVPPSRRSAQAQQTPAKKIFKESEIRQFYTDAALGRIPLDVKQKREQEILQAVLENRVLYGR